MRIKCGSTRLDTDEIAAYRVETNTSDPLVRIFLRGGGSFLCISPRYEGLKIEDIIKKLDKHFFEAGDDSGG